MRERPPCVATYVYECYPKVLGRGRGVDRSRPLVYRLTSTYAGLCTDRAHRKKTGGSSVGRLWVATLLFLRFGGYEWPGFFVGGLGLRKKIGLRRGRGLGAKWFFPAGCSSFCLGPGPLFGTVFSNESAFVTRGHFC